VNTRLILLVALLSGLAAQAADAVQAESRIEKVLVLADRAEVTRTVTVTAPKGESVVVVEGLLKDLDDRTLRTETAQGAVIQGVSTDIVKRKILPPTDKAALVKRLGELQACTDAIEATVLGLQRQVELARTYRGRTLDAIGLQAGLPAGNLPQGKIDLESWKGTLDALSSEEARTLEKTRDLEVERFAVQQETEELRKQLKDHDEPKIQEVRRALVGLSSPQGGPVTFALVYRVAGPTWRLHYDLRFDTVKEMLQVEAFGVVLQGTKEDWQDVELTLSTRLPSCGLKAPQAPTLVLEGRESQVVAQEVSSITQNVLATSVPATKIPVEPKEGEEKPAETKEQPGERKPAPLAKEQAPTWVERKGLEEYVALQSSTTGQTFKVLKRSTVNSGSGPQQVPIIKAETRGTVLLECVPKQSSTVYRRVTAKNTSGQPLLAGHAALFLDGGMVGLTTTPPVAPGDELALSFGAAEGLHVVLNSESGDGAAGEAVATEKGRRTYAFSNRYELHNRGGQPAEVRVLDVVPVSEVKDVEVHIDAKASTQYESLGDGILGFRIKAGAKKTATAALRYSIVLPDNIKF
jgi:uncharacterized protein (TIGR02231 family)